MNYEEAVREAKSGKLRPLYLVVGEERVLVDRVVAALRKAALLGGIDGFNEDKVTAGDTDVDRIINAAKTVPMMAKKRFVLVRALEKWDGGSGDDESAASSKAAGAMDKLTAYAAAPIDSTCMVLVGAKLDGRRKLMTLARKQGFLVQCDLIARNALPSFIEKAAKQRGHAISSDVSELLAEIAGPELGYVLDAIERLSLYVGEGAAIRDDDVAVCVTRIRLSTVWELVGALGRRDSATALRVLFDVYDPHDRGLRLVGALSYSVRQLLRFAIARQNGAGPEDAAQKAGVPPFKARELNAQVKNLPVSTIENWLTTLAETDLSLKGSKRHPRSILENAILTMTINSPR